MLEKSWPNTVVDGEIVFFLINMFRNHVSVCSAGPILSWIFRVDIIGILILVYVNP